MSHRRTGPNADIDAAVAASSLRGLPGDLVTELTAGATRHTVAAGSALYREGALVPHLEIVLSGLVRVHLSAPDGRTMTVRYCRPGSVLGVATLFSRGHPMPATIQALVNSELLALRPEIVLRLAEREVRVARALLGEVSDRAMAFLAEASGTAFATVRERVARHLLDLASDHQRGAALVVPVSQQELADAVGTVREVVVRELRDLRAAGIVRTGRHEIAVLDADRLARLAWIGPAEWNTGS